MDDIDIDNPVLSSLLTANVPCSFLGQCEECGLDVKGEASVVKGLHYHPKCFTCDECKRPIGSEKYFVIKRKKYCQNDKNVSLKVWRLKILKISFNKNGTEDHFCSGEPRKIEIFLNSEDRLSTLLFYKVLLILL